MWSLSYAYIIAYTYSFVDTYRIIRYIARSWTERRRDVRAQPKLDIGIPIV